MNKITSLDELRKIKEQSIGDVLLRTTGEDPDRTVILVGMSTCGIAAGAKDIMEAFIEEVNNNKLANVSVMGASCMGNCSSEPIVEVRIKGQEAVKYGKVDAALAKEIVSKHIMQGVLVESAIVGKEVVGRE